MLIRSPQNVNNFIYEMDIYCILDLTKPRMPI